jgi:hypothetical protein
VFSRKIWSKKGNKRKKKITEINNARKAKDVVWKIGKKVGKKGLGHRKRKKKRRTKRRKKETKENKWIVSRNLVIINLQHKWYLPQLKTFGWTPVFCLRFHVFARGKTNVGLLDYYSLLYAAGITGESEDHFPHRNGRTLHSGLCTHPEDYKTVLNQSPQQDSHCLYYESRIGSEGSRK